MAQILNTTNHLDKQMKKQKNKILFWGILFFFNFLIFFRIAPFISSPLHLILGYMMFRSYHGYRKIKSGVEGEKSALSVLDGLGSDYTIISDLEIEYDSKKSQIDSVIVGSNGVFVMETKNVRGYIVGNEEDHDIIVHKVGRKGGEYSTSLYNPCKQVGTQVFRLSKLLQSNGIYVWVQGMVFFSNPETEVEFKSNKIPVFSCENAGASEIKSYISNFEGKEISKDIQGRIINMLKNYTIK